MAKAPFERVFSLIERKKLLRRVAKDNLKVLIKFANNQVGEFKVQSVDDQSNLTGIIVGPMPRDFEKTTALFYVDHDRYFLTTRIKKKGEQWVILNSAEFFKFNRRTAFRVRVPENLQLTYFIMSVRNIEVSKPVEVIDFSSGGARIKWFLEKKMSNGTPMKGVFQWGKGKVIPVEAVIVHCPQPGTYGIRFVNLTSVTVNRLKMLSVEIQQTVHFGAHKS